MSVPEGVRVRVTVRSGDGAAHQLEIEGGDPPSLSVPAGGRASSDVAGLRSGQRRSIVEAGGGRATLRVLAQPGP